MVIPQAQGMTFAMKAASEEIRGLVAVAARAGAQ